MPDKYYYELNDGGLTVVVVDELGPLNTWSSEPPGNCLVIESGAVDAEPIGLVLKDTSPPLTPVLTLRGASWKSEEKDEGDVDAHLVSGCKPTRWILKKVE